MKKQFTVKGWQVEFDWQGMTLTPPEQVDRYREVKLEAWMQAADVFTPGGMLFAPVPVRRQKDRERGRRRDHRRSL